MKKEIKKSEKITAEKKISFSEGLEIVREIQKKVEAFNKTKPSSRSSNEYSF